MNMTLEQYILNPMGKNNAVMNSFSRETQRNLYMRKFDNILLRENGKIEYHLYKDTKNNTYWAHIKVPSEVVKKFYYDVVFKFSADEKTSLLGENLFKCNCQFYSNDPAFMYTYAHVFFKNGLFIKELQSKMSKIALREPAKEKNPGEIVGYVKALYFGYLLMQNRKLNKKSKFEAEAQPLDLGVLLSVIENAETKVADRERRGAEVSKRKKIQVSDTTFKNIRKVIGRNADLSNTRLQTTTTKRISSIRNSSSGVKSTRSVRSIKKK